ncbi:MAG: sensor histidine kinase [Flavobacteriaceae bacterium]
MKKANFIILVVLMIFSIVGIMWLQGYWIYSSWENKEEEFSLSVNQSLQSVAKEIQEREINDYIMAYQKLIDSVGTPSDSNFTDIFFFMDEDDTSNLSTFFAYGILQEDYNVNPSYIDPSIGENQTVSDYKKVRTTAIISNEIFNRENRMVSTIQKLKRVDRLNAFDQVKYREAFMEYASTLPIHRRLNNPELAFLLKREFNEKKISIPYEFGIYNGGLATRIRSNNYHEIREGPQYSTPVFTDAQGLSPYELVVTFPDRDRFVLSSIFGVAGLSLVLTVFIIIVSTSAVYQIIRQKKISEIKTDFINNMSHEFKTPIATINLALDAIGNPKVLNAPEMISKYANMIREENTRMLTQVENVLRISQLERSNSKMEFESIDLKELVDEAISHVALIVESKSGYVKTHFTNEPAFFEGNQNHFLNVIINILDNAIKYADGPPQVDVYIDQIDQQLELKIEDQGIGMSATTQKHVFEKFYRAQSGNIHDIKGHGLGLAYVKNIVDQHHGKIKIVSKKGEGTKFSILLPQKTAK